MAFSTHSQEDVIQPLIQIRGNLLRFFSDSSLGPWKSTEEFPLAPTQFLEE